MTTATPPAWAETLLRLFMSRDRFPSVSGDLLEQYRDSILPTCGQATADRWYINHAVAFAARKAIPWAALFVIAFLARSAWDWFLPPTDFQTRSQITGILFIATWLATGAFTAWRTGSFASGLAAGIAATTLAAFLNIAGHALLYAIWHDPTTLQAINNSGGLEEVFVLPFILMIPGVAMGTIGGIAGATARRLLA